MKHVYFYILTLALSFPVELLAALKYESTLVTIPGYDPDAGNLSSFVNTIYALSISVAALLAVIKIVIAGVRWMLSDVITSKAEAKKDIQGALFGLIIIISAVLIIYIINPSIVSSS